MVPREILELEVSNDALWIIFRPKIVAVLFLGPSTEGGGGRRLRPGTLIDPPLVNADVHKGICQAGTLPNFPSLV